MKYYANDKGMVMLMGKVFEWKTGDVAIFPDEFPLRRSVGPRATAEQLDADLKLLLEPGPSDVCVVKEILQSKTVDGEKWYKVYWEGSVKRDATWEPTTHLTEWGADTLVAEFRLKQRSYMARQLHLDEDTLAVMELMQRHGLKKSAEIYLQRYKNELTGVSDKRLRELHGKAYEAVQKKKKMAALRMNPESKKPSPEMPFGNANFRLLVRGHR